MSAPLRAARRVVEGGEGAVLEPAVRRFSADPGRDLRRMDPPGRAATLAAAAVLEESGLVLPPGEITDRVFLWVATEGGSAVADAAFWETARGDGGILASPSLFAATLPSSLAGEVARVLGLAGPAMVTAGPPSAALEAEALAAAAGVADLLLLLVVRAGEAPRVEAAALPPGGAREG